MEKIQIKIKTQHNMNKLLLISLLSSIIFFSTSCSLLYKTQVNKGYYQNGDLVSLDTGQVTVKHLIFLNISKFKIYDSNNNLLKKIYLKDREYFSRKFHPQRLYEGGSYYSNETMYASNGNPIFKLKKESVGWIGQENIVSKYKYEEIDTISNKLIVSIKYINPDSIRFFEIKDNKRNDTILQNIDAIKLIDSVIFNRIKRITFPFIPKTNRFNKQ